MNLGEGFAIDLEAIVGAEDGLLASIMIEGDQGAPWVLLLNGRRSWANVVEETTRSRLVSGEREILVVPVTSDPPGSKGSMLPARGYQSFEGDRPVAAVQYLGAGAFGYNKNVVYMRRDLDSKTKLVLAAAATTIMQAKIDVQAE